MPRPKPVTAFLAAGLVLGLAAVVVALVGGDGDGDGTGSDRRAAAGGTGSPSTTGGAGGRPAPDRSAGGTATTAPPAGRGGSAVLGSTTLPPTTAPGAPAPAQLRLEPQGLGPVRVGMTVAQASTALGRRLRGLGGDGAPACEVFAPEGGPEGLALMVADGRVVRVDVIAAGLETTAGVVVGQSEEEAQRRYGGRLRTAAHPTYPAGHELVLVAAVPDPAGTDLRLVLETDGRVVTSMRAGRRPEVDEPSGCL